MTGTVSFVPGLTEQIIDVSTFYNFNKRENTEVFLMSLSELANANVILGNFIAVGEIHKNELTSLLIDELQSYASNYSETEFLELFNNIFGTDLLDERVKALRQQWIETNFDFEIFPDTEIRTKDELGGAISAYSSEANKIYQAREYLIENLAREDSSGRENLAKYLLYGFGHFLDSYLNPNKDIDLDLSDGDQGAIFSAFAPPINRENPIEISSFKYLTDPIGKQYFQPKISISISKVEDSPSKSDEGDSKFDEDEELVFAVTLDRPSPQRVSVYAKFIPWTASYEDTNGEFVYTKIVFEPGETRKEIKVKAVADNIIEDTERFSVILERPENGFLDQAEAQGEIIDLDILSRPRKVDLIINSIEPQSGTRENPKIFNLPYIPSDVDLDIAEITFSYINNYNFPVRIVHKEGNQSVDVGITDDYDPFPPFSTIPLYPKSGTSGQVVYEYQPGGLADNIQIKIPSFYIKERLPSEINSFIFEVQNLDGVVLEERSLLVDFLAVGEHDLSVVKIPEKSTTQVGEVFTYTIAIVNNGSYESNVVGEPEYLLTEILPKQFKFLRASGTNGETIPAKVLETNDESITLQFHIGGARENDPEFVTITVEAIEQGNIPNISETTVEINDKRFVDSNLENNTHPEEFPIVIKQQDGVDLEIYDEFSPGIIGVGTEHTYKFVVENKGNLTANGFIVDVLLPSGFQLIDTPDVSTLISIQSIGNESIDEQTVLKFFVSQPLPPATDESLSNVYSEEFTYSASGFSQPIEYLGEYL